jgi:hypothetical protein
VNARRFPRTLDEAYGPYHRSSQCHIEPMGGSKPKTRPADVALYIVGVIGVIAAIVFNNFGA